MCLAALYSYFLPIELDKTTEKFLLGILSGLTLLDILGGIQLLCGQMAPNITLANPRFNQASRHWDQIRSGKGNLLKFVKENQNVLGPGFDNPPGNDPPPSEASREVANLTERKYPHTPVYGVKEFVCLSVGL